MQVGRTSGAHERTARARCRRAGNRGGAALRRQTAVAAGLGSLLLTGAAAAHASSGPGQSWIATGTASAPAHHRLVALAGSHNFLVYSKFPDSDTGTGAPFTHDGKLYVLRRDGHRSLLTRVTHAAADFSLAGHMLTYYDADPNRTQGGSDFLINLRTGTRHRLRLGNGQHVASAAPSGYLAVHASSDAPLTLDEVDVHGEVRDLGSPFPGGQHFAVVAGSARFVVVGESGGLKTATFRHPSRFHRLRRAGAPQSGGVCGPPGKHYAACTIAPPQGLPFLGLLNMHGHVLGRDTEHCAGNAEASPVLHEHAFWLDCGPHRLWQLSYSSVVASSRHHTFRSSINGVVVNPVDALGQIVLTSNSESKLLGMTAARSQPKVVVRVH